MAATRRAASEEEDRGEPRRRERPRRGGGDLGPRILVAIPAIAFALFIVLEGGEVFALGLLVLGVVALQELYTLMGRVRPVDLAGFLALAGLLVAALYGEPRHVIMVLVAAFPLVFLLALVRPRARTCPGPSPPRSSGSCGSAWPWRTRCSCASCQPGAAATNVTARGC